MNSSVLACSFNVVNLQLHSPTSYRLRPRLSDSCRPLRSSCHCSLVQPYTDAKKISLLIYLFVHHHLGPPTRRLWGIFVVPSLLRTPANESVRFQECLKHRFLTRRARLPPSPLEAPTNNEPTEPTPDGKVRARAERNKDVDLPNVSPISPLVVHWHLCVIGCQCPRRTEQRKATRRTCGRSDR